MLTGGACAATIRVLGAADLQTLLSPAEVIAAVEKAYAWKSERRTSTFPLVFHEFEPGVADMDIKSGHLAPAGIFGMKLVSFFEPNIKKGLTPLAASIMLYDDATGRLRAVIEGAHLGGLRTGAAAAIGAQVLARPDSREATIAGCGHQCIYQIASLLAALPHLERINLCDPLDFSFAQAKAEEIKGTLKTLLTTIPSACIEAEDLEKAVRRSDIIVTATPAYTPYIKADWITGGTHLSCVGADMSGKQEIDPAILSHARIFVDDRQQCAAVGEIELALASGAISEQNIIGEIGDVITGAVSGRVSDEDITVFDTTGLAIQDLATAKAALDVAEANNIGTVVAF